MTADAEYDYYDYYNYTSPSTNSYSYGTTQVQWGYQAPDYYWSSSWDTETGDSSYYSGDDNSMSSFSYEGETGDTDSWSMYDDNGTTHPTIVLMTQARPTTTTIPPIAHMALMTPHMTILTAVPTITPTVAHTATTAHTTTMAHTETTPTMVHTPTIEEQSFCST